MWFQKISIPPPRMVLQIRPHPHPHPLGISVPEGSCLTPPPPPKNFLFSFFSLFCFSMEKNTERVDAAVSALRETQENLTTARQEFLDSINKSERKLAAVRVDKIEKDVNAQLAELRRAQDALRKATEARKKLLQLEVESQPADSNSDDSTC